MIDLVRTDVFQNRTFNSASLSTDLLKFITNSLEEKACSVRILSTIGDQYTAATFKLYTNFTNYYRRLNVIDSLMNDLSLIESR